MTLSLQQFLHYYLGVGHFLLTQRHQSQSILLRLLAQVFSCEDMLSCSHMGYGQLGDKPWAFVCRPLSTHQALTAAGRVLFPSLLPGHCTSLADLKVSAWLVGQASQLQGPAKQAF